ncbi:hypothetical protein ABT336_02605 [Micromonospora sp. NPDC000207]|uniref:CdiA C-terminal domain-containing protein n=1 Tax=Micromonospora sp. NPDC000207 TaxID=3154246 RepID=UPI00332941E9
MNRRSLELENQCADLLAGKGYQVHQNPTRQQVAQARLHTGDTGDPGKEPDYLIEGHVFDCYSPTSLKNVRGVWKEAVKKFEKGQTQRVVIDLHDWLGDLTALQRQFDDWPVPGMREVAAVTREGAIIQIVPRRGEQTR